MKKYFFPLALLIAINGFAQSKDEMAIRNLMEQQTVAWNNGNIVGFMKGYWENDSLMFIGKSGITYGWNNTLANYKKGYPDTASMGKLDFHILKVSMLTSTQYQVVGQWHLKRSIGDLQGYYTLLLRKIKGVWVIVQDHSS